MTKLITSDLIAANKEEVLQSIPDLITKANKLQSDIEAFISNSKGKLSGKGYDTARHLLNSYVDALSNQQKILNDVYESVISANNYLINYAKGYSELDDSLKDEIYNKMNSIYSNIGFLDRLYENNEYDNYFTFQYEDFRSSLLYQYNKLYELYNIINDLQNADTHAYNIIKNSNENNANFSISIAGSKLVSIFRQYDVDINHFKPETLQKLESVYPSWPSDMEKKRIQTIVIALTLWQQEPKITYSQKDRALMKDGKPVSMDCSRFISYCYANAGCIAYDDEKNPDKMSPMGDRWASNKFLGWEISKSERESDKTIEFERIMPSDIEPGDLAVLYDGTRRDSDGKKKENHVVMYIGNNTDGEPLMIECHGGGIEINPLSKYKYEVYLKYKYFNIDMEP